jgi:hypothetical protein
MAQRIARIELRRARFRRQLSITLDLRGMLAKPGDLVIYHAPEIGIEETVFEVDAFTFARNGDALVTRLDLVEYDGSIFDWDETVDELDMNRGEATIDNIRSRGVIDPEAAVTGYTVGGFNTTGSIQVDWTNPTNSESELKRVDLSVLAIVETTDGSSLFEWPDNAPVTSSITNGDETKTLSFSIANAWPGPHIVLQVKLSNTSTIQAFFKNNVEGPIQPID